MPPEVYIKMYKRGRIHKNLLGSEVRGDSNEKFPSIQKILRPLLALLNISKDLFLGIKIAKKLSLKNI